MTNLFPDQFRATNKNPACKSQNGANNPGQNSIVFNNRFIFLGSAPQSMSEDIWQSVEKKVDDNEKNRGQEISKKIEQWEKAGDDKATIKNKLKAEKDQLISAEINKALKKQNIQIQDSLGNRRVMTYQDLKTNPASQGRLATLEKTLFGKTDTDKFVEDYYLQKGLKKGSITGALTDLPPATATPDLLTTNPEIKHLEEVRAARDAVLTTSQKKRADLMQDESIRYRKTTMAIDEYTSPDSKTDHSIQDYDDGYTPWGKHKEKSQDDHNNPTRDRLNGLYYANYIFAGGGESGMNAVKNQNEAAYKLYYTTIGDSRFTMKDFNVGLGMSRYVNDAEKYTKNDLTVGMIAGLLKLTDDSIKDATQHQKFMDYLKMNFVAISMMPEEKQIETLFKLKSLNETLELAPDWRNAYTRIDRLTDPDSDETLSGSIKIDDYPGTGSANKNNKTRHQLNGYLYATYLANGSGKAGSDAADEQYRRAARMFDRSGMIDKDFTQKHMENQYVDSSRKEEGFGLQPYLKESETFTKFDTIQGAVAGMLQIADLSMVDVPPGSTSPSNLQAMGKKEYQLYLRSKFELLNKYDTEETQLMYIATIKSPKDALTEFVDEKRVRLVDLMILACKQHPQFKFSDSLTKELADPKKVFSQDELDKKTETAWKEVQAYIESRYQKAFFEKIKPDLTKPEIANPDSLLNKYKILNNNNSKLKKPLYSAADMDILNKEIEKVNKSFDSARMATKSSKLEDMISQNYLALCLEAEKGYYDQANELDKKLQAVEEESKNPDKRTPVTAGAPSGPGNGTKLSVPSDGSEGVREDPIQAAWEKGEDITPKIGDYKGKLETTSAKLNGRDEHGNVVNVLDKGTELNRFDSDVVMNGHKVGNTIFVRAHFGNKPVWIAENLLKTVAKELEESPA